MAGRPMSYSQLAEAPGPTPPSSDDDDDDGVPRTRIHSDEQKSPAKASPGVTLLERSSESPVAAESVGAPRLEEEQSEGVFEIRDFTNASTFERLVHGSSLAVKRWRAELERGLATDSLDSLSHREEFEIDGLKYDLLFQHSPLETPSASSTTSSPSGTGAPLLRRANSTPSERLGLHTFPARAHRLQRWFGVQHFVMLTVRDQSIDHDSARTVLSALLLAAKSAVFPCVHPLSCFVPIDGGRRRRFMGEVVDNGWRTVYTTDASQTIDSSLEHLTGLLDFFWQKMGADPEDPQTNLNTGVRFTYLTENFEPLPRDGGVQGAAALRPRSNSSASTGSSGSGKSGGSGGQAFRPPARPARPAPAKEPHATEEANSTSQDAVESIQLHCLWPSFPRGSFVDNAVYSELDPRAAPYWKLRVMKSEKPELPRSQQLRNLLEFRKEARSVRSAEHSVQPQMPKTALASLSYAIQESLESILLPSIGEMMELTSDCISCPISVSGVPNERAGASKPHYAALRGAACGSRLARIAELGAEMRCFKGAVMLWCQVLTESRRQWDACEAVWPVGAASPPTSRGIGSGVRAEHFSTSACLVQQKLEMLQRSVEARRRAAPPVAEAAQKSLKLKTTVAIINVPPLMPPALVTEDMAMQFNLMVENITDPVERAELTCGREIRSDIAAFKAANPEATLEQFLAWRDLVERLDEVLPEKWLEALWEEAGACAAAKQPGKLFEPEKEAEMALHYLENIEGTQLLLQLFRVLVSVTLEELGNSLPADSFPAHLRALRDRAEAAILAAFGEAALISDAAAAVLGEGADFPEEESLQAAISAVEALETAVRLSASLRLKLPGAAAALVDELLVEGEAPVTCFKQRVVVENLFEHGRALLRAQGREAFDGKKVLECLPFSKEFVVLLQPGAPSAVASSPSAGVDAKANSNVRRMYAEIRQRHLRLAIARSFRLS